MGDIDIIVTMLSNGAISTVHRRDSKGNSAFIVAAGRGQTNALKILLSHGALLEDSTKYTLQSIIIMP
jgi:ankyrin repeat protein